MTADRTRLPELDGWRATSILLVLAGHLLPIGPKALRLNDTAGAMGMALFFAISGFLIVRFLAENMPLGVFAMRRLARIVPLAWVTMAVLALVASAEAGALFANLFFFANLPPAKLLPGGEHLWSLCVEMQFYVAAAALCLVARRRGLLLLPLLCIAVTTLRIADGQTISIVTWHRVDEILAGGTVALAYCGKLGNWAVRMLRSVPPSVALVLLGICSHPSLEVAMYFRPYSSALVIASCLHGTNGPLGRVLRSRPMAYIAEISYALYVVHGALAASWLGSGGLVERYAKRPFLLAATFALAHVSTYRLERPLLRLARRLEKGRNRTQNASAVR